jgi:hypothetical protein
MPQRIVITEELLKRDADLLKHVDKLIMAVNI